MAAGLILARPQMKSIDTQTKLCAVIGHPVGHSLSPAIHNAAFAQLGLNFVYLAFDVTDVKSVLAGMRAMPSWRGLSVTIPHKLAVIEHLDEIDPIARHIGSVNTITNEDGKLLGDSTDGPGTLRAFEEAGIELKGKRVLFLGSGGAVRAVAFAMAEMTTAAGITILGRTRKNVEQLVADLNRTISVSIAAGDLAKELAGAMESHDVIINGMPIGMAPKDDGASPVHASMLKREHAVFDMVYRPMRTRLIEDAERAGCRIVLGREMLIHQAALQFERWTGERAPIGVMRGAFDAASIPRT